MTIQLFDVNSYKEYYLRAENDFVNIHLDGGVKKHRFG